jgi:hypothetical protein
MNASERRHHRQLNDRLLMVQTILMAILLFVAAPLQANGLFTAPLFGILFGLVLIPGVLMVRGNTFAVTLILIAIALVIVAAAKGVRAPSNVDKILDDIAWLIGGLTLSAVVARAVYAPGKVTIHRVVGGALLYLTIGLVFVGLISGVVLLDPNAYTNLQPLQENYPKYIYYSFTTLSTTGYGDIVPVHPYARGLANIEQMIGQLFPATLLARLVTLELKNQSQVAHHSMSASHDRIVALPRNDARGHKLP